MGKNTVEDVIDLYGEASSEFFKPHFDSAGISYPPADLAILAYKDTKIMEIWAKDPSSEYSLIYTYPILAASGSLGPKLREGDRQVPEGVYHIEAFNPNSAYHLSMKLNYPNSFDLKHAGIDGRSEPGTNIFIHGRAVSVGCLAIGDKAIEEVFSLVHEVGRNNTKVIILPNNPSIKKLEVPVGVPKWTVDLYRMIEQEYLAINPK